MRVVDQVQALVRAMRLLAIAGLPFVCACAERSHVSDAPGVSGSATAKPVPAPYPRARWRLAAWAELDRTVLWVSHILVRHAESEKTLAPLSTGDWHILEPSRRDRRAALERATLVAERCLADPDSFGALAREFSDDPITRNRGGSLGGVTAIELVLWPEVLDALATLKHGESSRVVETNFGFHVFLRRPPPPAQTLAGRRIVIGYEGAEWLDFARRGERAKRSRSAAFKIAADIVNHARSQPGQFQQLVQERSEHRDAVDGGDLGVWSLREPSILARELEILGQLAIGEVSEPIDTFIGVVVLERTAVQPRKPYAMSAVRVDFDPKLPSTDAFSKVSRAKLAWSLAKELARAPERMPELQQQYCCSAVEQWTQGRGPPNLTVALERLRLGELLPEPIESDWNFVIARRLDPAEQVPAPLLLADLPSPSAPDLTHVLRTTPERGLPVLVELMCDEGQRSLNLPEGDRAALDKLHDALLEELLDSENLEQRQIQFDRGLRGIAKALGITRFEQYQRAVAEALTDGLLQRP